METDSTQNLLLRIEELENRLAESEQFIEAIKAGEVDAFALNKITNLKFLHFKAVIMLTAFCRKFWRRRFELN